MEQRIKRIRIAEPALYHAIPSAGSLSLKEGRRTFPVCLAALEQGHASARQTRHQAQVHALVVSDSRFRRCGLSGDKRDVHVHEAQDHVVCNVWDIKADHVRGSGDLWVEYLSANYSTLALTLAKVIFRSSCQDPTWVSFKNQD
jgi:hypothetical protein